MSGSAMKDRTKAFEAKYAHDADMQFKVISRGVRSFGIWVAGELGIQGEEEITAYTESVIEADFDEPGFQDIYRKVLADYEARGLKVTEDTLDQQLYLHLEEAEKKAKAEG